jgi:hypothetical protein
MSLSANQCLRKDVFAKDGKLGVFVNVVLDKETKEARMLVMPKLADRRRTKSMVGSADTVGRSVVSTITSAVGSVTGAEVLTDIAFEASRKAQDRMTGKTQRESYMYYLMPVTEIDRLEKDKLCLAKSAENYEIYMDLTGTDCDVAFFNDEMYKDIESCISISLNLPTIRGLSLRDPNNNKGKVVDVLFDGSVGLVTALIVTTLGRGIQLRSVDIDAVNFAELSLPMSFENYPAVVPAPSKK